jgi:peroxiredoxin
MVVRWQRLAESPWQLREMIPLGPSLAGRRSLTFDSVAVGNDGRTPGPSVERSGCAGTKPDRDEKGRSLRQAAMVPRPCRMRFDSNSDSARLRASRVVCAAAMLAGCGAGAAAPSAAPERESDFAAQTGQAPLSDKNAALERKFVGRAAPSLDGLVSIDQQRALGWSTLRGQVVVLDFWAPWCGVCHVVAEDLNRWRLRFGERLQVIGIAAGPVERVAAHALRFHMQYSIAADPHEKVSDAFDAFAVPLVVVVDASGVVRAITMGYSSPRMAKMEELVEQLLSLS